MYYYKFYVQCHAVIFKSNSARETAEYIIECFSNVVGISFTDLRETSNDFNYSGLFEAGSDGDVKLLICRLEYAYSCVEEKIEKRKL